MQMQSTPTVLVKKGGFLSAVAQGVFLFLTVSVVCVTLLGYKAMQNFNPERILTLGQKFLADPPNWAAILPPILADAGSDRRAPEYVDDVDVKVRLLPTPFDARASLAVVELHNRGDESISFLALNLRIENGDGVPIDETTAYGATPLPLPDCDWRGPLLPGATRKFTALLHDFRGNAETAAIEISDVRVFAYPANAPAISAPAVSQAMPLSAE